MEVKIPFTGGHRMREYTVRIMVSNMQEHALDFEVYRHGELVGEITAPLMSGLEGVVQAIAKNYEAEPLEGDR